MTTDMLIEQNLLYEDYRKNCVFYREKPGICILRGTGDEKWIKIIREISNNYWVFKKGTNPEDIYICESPIDCISVYECNHHRDGYYCALAGLKRKGEKEIGHSKLVSGNQSPEERECRRESEPLVPTDVFTPGHRVLFL